MNPHYKSQALQIDISTEKSHNLKNEKKSPSYQRINEFQRLLLHQQ